MFPRTVDRARDPCAVSARNRSGVVAFLGNVPFRSAWQRAQQLALGLAAHDPVVYVDPNHSFVQRWLRPSQRVEPTLPAGVRLQLCAPPAGLPLARSLAWFHRVNCARSRRQLGRFLRRCDSAPIRAVVATFPDQWELVRALPDEVPVVYDVMDDFTLFLRPWQRPRFEEMHRRLLERARFKTTSSWILQARHAQWGYRLHYLGNGVRASLSERCAHAVPDPDLAALPRPILGYVGMVSRWLDLDTVRALAQAFPGGTVVLVGPRDVRLPALPANVHWRGPVRQEQLPAVLRAFDLGLIPFVPGPAIDAVNPIKFYEYLAAGLPVLAADFAEMRAHAGQATLYRGPAEAVAGAAWLLAHGTCPCQVRRRQAYALANTWEEQANELRGLIERAACGWLDRPARDPQAAADLTGLASSGRRVGPSG